MAHTIRVRLRRDAKLRSYRGQPPGEASIVAALRDVLFPCGLQHRPDGAIAWLRANVANVHNPKEEN